MGAKVFTLKDYYYLPKLSPTYGTYICPICVDDVLFKGNAQIYVATIHTRVEPKSGFGPLTRWVEISTIGYQDKVVEEKLLTTDIWSPGAKQPHDQYVTITDFIYGLGLNLFPITIKVEPSMWIEDVGFDITIELSIGYKL